MLECVFGFLICSLLASSFCGLVLRLKTLFKCPYTFDVTMLRRSPFILIYSDDTYRTKSLSSSCITITFNFIALGLAFSYNNQIEIQIEISMKRIFKFQPRGLPTAPSCRATRHGDAPKVNSCEREECATSSHSSTRRHLS